MLRREEFGSKVDLVSESVDGSKLIEGWSGPAGWARTQYWGFDAKQLPRQGRVWFPDGDGPFPLVLMVHGNHDMEDFSDPGYAYLGELFASRGIIAVSVDENFLNSSIRRPGRRFQRRVQERERRARAGCCSNTCACGGSGIRILPTGFTAKSTWTASR